MEIQVGEYVRFKKGQIRKITGRDVDGHLIVDIHIYGSNWLTFNEEAEIVKHSKNIINLIEVGDYVNGYRVEQISIETNEVLLDHNGFGWRTLKDGDKIVTHEQFSQVEYEVQYMEAKLEQTQNEIISKIKEGNKESTLIQKQENNKTHIIHEEKEEKEQKGNMTTIKTIEYIF